MRMQTPGAGGGGAQSFLESRLAARKATLRKVMRRFGDLPSYARARRTGQPLG